MNKKPKNKWIARSARLFIYFLVLVVISIIFIDLPTPPKNIDFLVTALTLIGIALPLASFVLSAYGLFKIDKNTENGTVDAIIILVLLGCYGALQIMTLFA